MHLLLQEVLVLWTKASREDPLLGQRMSVSKEYTLPSLLLPRASILKHRLAFSETSGFTMPDVSCEELQLTESVQQGCVRGQRSSAARWDITYQRTADCGGLPLRDNSPQQKSLVLGQWGRVCYQGRLPDRNQVQWVYYAKTVNIGWITCLEPGLFFNTRPVWMIEDSPHFF